jgi:membrane-bound lytic murein transglycosylase D
MLVKAGSTLLVPRLAQRTTDVPEHVADNAHMALAPDRPPLRKVSIQARKGDTVSTLAQRYKVSAAQLAQWNRLSVQTRLNAGQQLVIWQADAPSKAGSRSKAAPAPVRRKAAVSSAPVRTANAGR